MHTRIAKSILKTLFSSVMVFATLLCAHATAGTVNAVSYYHVDFEHYFVTAIAAEQAVLDSGAIAGWYRTGMRYKVESEPGPGLVPVCRFFSAAFGGKGTHFFTPFAQECALLHTDPNWVYEGVAFYVRLPASDGTCAPGMAPVYRFYNANRNGTPNHIYTPARSHGVELLAAGWVAEGIGPDIVAFCVPTSADRAMAQTQKLAGKRLSISMGEPTAMILQADTNLVGTNVGVPDPSWDWPDPFHSLHPPFEVVLSMDYDQYVASAGTGGWDPFADTFIASISRDSLDTVTYFDSVDSSTSPSCTHQVFSTDIPAHWVNPNYWMNTRVHPFQKIYLGRCIPGVVRQM